MWIFTNDGFFSIAQHYTEMDCFQVKSRVSDVLEKLWPESEIEIIEDADYMTGQIIAVDGGRGIN